MMKKLIMALLTILTLTAFTYGEKIQPVTSANEIGEILKQNLNNIRDFQGIEISDSRINETLNSDSDKNISTTIKAIEKRKYTYKRIHDEIRFKGNGEKYAFHYLGNENKPPCGGPLCDNKNPAKGYKCSDYLMKSTEASSMSPLFLAYGAIAGPGDKLSSWGKVIQTAADKGNVTISREKSGNTPAIKVEILTVNKDSKITFWLDPAKDYQIIRKESGTLIHTGDSKSIYLLEEEITNQFKYDSRQKYWIPAKVIQRKYINCPPFYASLDTSKEMIAGNITPQRILQDETIYRYKDFMINQGFEDSEYIKL